MFWIASFPRSGVTFLRIILWHCYDVDSREYHPGSYIEKGWESAIFVKTHVLPNRLGAYLEERKVIHLVRNGLDACTSMAWQLCRYDPDRFEAAFRDIVSGFDDHKHFGGWSRHTRQWSDLADLSLRFEDLVQYPRKTVENIRSIWPDMPPPNGKAIPTFEQLKHELDLPVRFLDHSPSPPLGLQANFFRRGKINGWRDELSSKQRALFEKNHGVVFHQQGYRYV